MRTLVASSIAADPVGGRLRVMLRALVDQQEPATADFQTLETRLPLTQPDLLAILLSPDPERGFEAIRKARRLVAGCILAVGKAVEPKLILRALSEGADHFVDEAELEAGLEAVLTRLHSKQEAGSGPTGRLIALLGASGGCGASTLAVNIAAALAKLHKSCALVDLKAGRGDLAALLNLRPTFNLADICLNVARLDRAMFEKTLVHHDSGIQLLAAAQTFGATRLVTTQGVTHALAMARRLYPYVVADLEDCFHEEQLATLRLANTIFVVCRLDFTSLRNIHRIVSHLEQADIARAKIGFVVNRYGQPNELPLEEAEDIFGAKAAYLVPEDARTINGANNTGVPAVLKAPSARVSQALVRMAQGAIERRRREAPAAIGLLARR